MFLIGGDERPLIGKEIGGRRVEHKDHENQFDMWDNYIRFDEVLDKRQTDKPHADDDESDQDICPRVHLHKRLNLFHIVFGDRFVQCKDNRRTHAEVCERKHHQNIGEHTVDAQIFVAQRMHEDRPVGKAH